MPTYALKYGDRTVVGESALGFDLLNDIVEPTKGVSDFRRGFSVTSSQRSASDTTWRPVWGEVSSIRNHYNELAVTFTQAPLHDSTKQRAMTVRFRVFDDGLGFRYEFPKQNELKRFAIKAEFTEFRLAGDHTAFWVPGDYDSQEYVHSISRLSTVNALAGVPGDAVAMSSKFASDAVQTPLMLKADDGLYINIHEAALLNYPATHLRVDRATHTLTTQLTPSPGGAAAYLQTPAQTPWRTIVVSDKAAEILASKLILNLNEPSRIADTSWIKPQKMIGVWWEMHVGKSSWNYSDEGSTDLVHTQWSSLKPNGRHAANNENVKRYIDFAARHGFDGVLVEGWNIGWEDWFGQWKEEVFDFVTPYPDFDVSALNDYARSKGVKLIMHHETSASATNYERKMDAAFQFMVRHGYDTVKTGYVGRIIPRGEHHDGQWMVNHYTRVIENAARYKICVDSHESVRPTGLHRTYPNWLAAEAARGTEFNAWSVGNPPEHETILPFTRLMGGPMDFTPGIFEGDMRVYNANSTHRVRTTLAKQLALYVTLYSPLQMAADLPENYEKHLDAFQFIKEVAVDWADTRYLEAEPGQHVIVARKEKGPQARWFLGAITNADARTRTIALDFLDPNLRYAATLYRDAEDAHWERKPKAYTIETMVVDVKSILELKLAPGGGAAMSFTPINKPR
jgi:hypothetical protein